MRHDGLWEKILFFLHRLPKTTTPNNEHIRPAIVHRRIHLSTSVDDRDGGEDGDDARRKATAVATDDDDAFTTAVVSPALEGRHPVQ